MVGAVADEEPSEGVETATFDAKLPEDRRKPLPEMLNVYLVPTVGELR